MDDPRHVVGPTTHVITSSHGQNLLAFPSVSSLYFSFCLDPAGLCLFLLAGTRASPSERAGGMVAAARSPSARRRRRRQGLPPLPPPPALAEDGGGGGGMVRPRVLAAAGMGAAAARALTSGGELRRVVFFIWMYIFCFFHLINFSLPKFFS